jgi:hypothetical protein
LTLDELGLSDDGPSDSHAAITGEPDSVPVSPVSIHEAETMPFEVVDLEQVDAGLEQRDDMPVGGATVATPSVVDQSEPGVPSSPTAAPSAPRNIPAGLGQFLAQLEAQPENHAMRLAVARMCERTGNVEQAMDHYRHLINQGALLDPVVEDLQEMVEGDYQASLRRRMRRLLGDAFMKQERFQEAMDAYSAT